MIDADRLDWDKGQGLIPAIVQDADTRRVLMLGWMDRAALARTLEGGRVTFYSRSRARLWTKGETSGHTLALIAIEADCDGDSLLVQARPHGPTCHLGTASCFAAADADFVAELDRLVGTRQCERPEGSYTTALFASGPLRIAQKLGEEGVETALAAASGDAVAVREEAADLVYHLLVLLRSQGLAWRDVVSRLSERHDPAPR